MQACARRRIGELLKQVDARGGERSKTDGTSSFAQKDAARDAGLSVYQQTSAGRIANVHAERFKRAIEAWTPSEVAAVLAPNEGEAALIRSLESI